MKKVSCCQTLLDQQNKGSEKEIWRQVVLGKDGGEAERRQK